MTNQIQEKEVTVMNITQKKIHSNKTNKDYTIQQVQCDDGITYETFDGEFVQNNLKINTKANIKYQIDNRTGGNGQVYTTYKLVTPRRPNPAMEEVKNLILESEKRIIAAIQNAQGSVDISGGPDDVINPNA